MSRRIYDSGVLLQEWDDVAQIYRRWSNAGVLLEQRAYTGAEIAAIVGAGAVQLTDRSMVVIDDDGSEIFRIGDMEFGDRGVSISGENGTPSIQIRKQFAGTAQVIQVRDQYGNFLIAEESLGSGLAYPILPIVMEPVLATAGTVNAGPYGFEVPTTSATFASVFRAQYARHGQFGSFTMRIAASDTSTSGEVRLVNAATGDHLGQFLAGPYTATRATGSIGYTEVVLPAIVLPGNPYVSIQLAVEARRTAGAGTLRVAIAESRSG